MEIERQTEVRLSTWLCEAIEDTIKRYQIIMGEQKKSVIEDEARAAEERQNKYGNPEMYERFVTERKRCIVEETQAVDELLTLLKAAQGLKQQITKFWEGQHNRWKETKNSVTATRKGG